MIPTKKSIKKIIIEWHRDIGYFLSGLIIIYCISGIALNHINDFNPDFIIRRDTVKIEPNYITGLKDEDKYTKKIVEIISSKVNEEKIKLWDRPTSSQIKIYYDNASLHIYLNYSYGVYEKVSKRPIIYETNLLHRNSVRGWKWVSDIFGILLIILTLTGLFILKGKYGLSGRGKWLLLSGLVPPFLAILYFILFQTN